MLILVLAANTAYADFPRLASILARDRFLPRQFMTQGDRLAFSNGIIVLSVLAGALLVVFDGDTHALIPLYMIGVFVSFTLSQAGMVRALAALREPGWRASAVVNGVGAVVTGVVLVVVAVTKFAEGAWIILLMIPILVVHLRGHAPALRQRRRRPALRGWRPVPDGRHVVIVPIGGVHRAVVQALALRAHALRRRAGVYVDVDPQPPRRSRDWPRHGARACRSSSCPRPYRSLLEPLLEYIEQVQREDPATTSRWCCPSSCPRGCGSTCCTTSTRC